MVVAGVGAILVLKHHALTKLRDENQALQQQVEQLARQAGARPPRSNLIAQASNSASLGQKQLQDLNRLRGEVGALRPQTNELAILQAGNRQLRSMTDEPGDPAEAIRRCAAPGEA